ncbi:hypothetical protein HK098_002015 [Nowakowskiella sp. JEL0407]|nr:hypothetical protein HK098_002015 [Nowakowskiella sp. JEL0407]
MGAKLFFDTKSSSWKFHDHSNPTTPDAKDNQQLTISNSTPICGSSSVENFLYHASSHDALSIASHDIGILPHLQKLSSPVVLEYANANPFLQETGSHAKDFDEKNCPTTNEYSLIPGSDLPTDLATNNATIPFLENNFDPFTVNYFHPPVTPTSFEIPNDLPFDALQILDYQLQYPTNKTLFPAETTLPHRFLNDYSPNTFPDESPTTHHTETTEKNQKKPYTTKPGIDPRRPSSSRDTYSIGIPKKRTSHHTKPISSPSTSTTTTESNTSDAKVPMYYFNRRGKNEKEKSDVKVDFSQMLLSKCTWEECQTEIFVLEVNGHALARRADNSMLNGTKLLNIAGLTRGKRDGVLKNEHPRLVIRNGSMIVKGVWISLSRARILSEIYGIGHVIASILSSNPSKYLFSNFDGIPNIKPPSLTRKLIQIENKTTVSSPVKTSMDDAPELIADEEKKDDETAEMEFDSSFDKFDNFGFSDLGTAISEPFLDMFNEPFEMNVRHGPKSADLYNELTEYFMEEN